MVGKDETVARTSSRSLGRKWLPADKLRRSVEYMTNKRAAPTASAAYTEIDTIAIDRAIACLSECPQGGNLLDHANQVGGSVVGPSAGRAETGVTYVTAPDAAACNGSHGYGTWSSLGVGLGVCRSPRALCSTARD